MQAFAIVAAEDYALAGAQNRSPSQQDGLWLCGG